MNSIWLKIAAAVVAVFIVIVVAGKFMSGEPAGSSAPRAETEEPQPTQPATTTQPQAAQPAPQPPQPTFEKLPFEQDLQAQKLFEHAKMEFKQSRLPMMTPARMVKDCREIIQRWPKSEYAFQAKRMLADLPEKRT